MTETARADRASVPTPRLDRLRRSPRYWREVASTEFVQGILRIMNEEGITGVQLAERYGSTPPNISQTLSSGGNYKLETMVKLAGALDAAVHIAVVPRTHWFYYQSFPKSPVVALPAAATPADQPANDRAGDDLAHLLPRGTGAMRVDSDGTPNYEEFCVG